MTSNSRRPWGWILLGIGILLLVLTPVWFMLAAGWGLSGYTWAEGFWILMAALGVAGIVTGIVLLVRARTH